MNVPRMSTTVPRYPASDVAAEAPDGHPEALGQVLRSRAFEKTPALRALLIFLWQHRHEAVSEYGIATEALGRRPIFDARTDATVRVQISRLRQRLERFYESEGQHATERLIIPLGSHQVHIESAKVAMTVVYPVKTLARGNAQANADSRDRMRSTDRRLCNSRAGATSDPGMSRRPTAIP